MTQAEALNILKTGANVFITGAAGSGKTHLLREYIEYLKERGANIGITASTGIAATHMGGITIHSWSGMGIRHHMDDGELTALVKRSYIKNRLRDVNVLIIDEVSMMHDFRLDLVDRIMRAAREPFMPFGGIQVVLSGDFFQLPPVSRGDEEPARFVYHSNAWRDLDLKICYLHEQHRQNDGTYFRILNAIRNNRVDRDLVDALNTRLNHEPERGMIEPTKLYTHNADVDEENERELRKLGGKEVRYEMSSLGNEKLVEALKNGCLSPRTLKLKEGARVMFTKNDFEEGYVNGTLGVVEKCTPETILVRARDGKLIDVGKTSWKVEEEGRVRAEIIQYPLRLAWAITVHKSQGMSLDAATVDLGKAFEKGMGYVALSRIRSFDGLFLKSINHVALGVDDEVFEFDESFRSMSARDADEINSLPKEALESKHAAFMKKFGGKKKEKLDTFALTKELLKLGNTLQDIAALRDLTFATILGHVERIKKEDPSFDITPLKREIGSERLETILGAFREIGPSETGKWRITPVRELLGDSYSYDEIGLARLFLER